MDDRTEKFISNVRYVFNTPKGLEILQVLVEDYVDPNPLAATKAETGFNIGQQELVKFLARTSKSTKEEDPVKVTQEYDDDDDYL